VEQDRTFELAADELASVESYRKLKDTAVLTIMFTDIVGFTQLTDERGERFSNEARRLHDEVLVGTITEGGAGIVVKHIGDAVMAVFSEPSTAVERALRIHEGLERLARERPDIGALEVKIGLDMGQVTVEEEVDVDVFGRHVNRASRIQALAAGGQVFMSYTVFDSARGWLVGPVSDRYEWTSHGRYALKGVHQPVEVFEVTDPARAPLRPPAGGKRVRSVPSAAWAAGFVLLGIAAAVLIPRFSAAEVWLVDYAPEASYLDRGTEVLLDGDRSQSERRLLVDVSPGTHVLHYDVADPVRFYAQLEVERGENYLSPDFFESRLPTLYRFSEAGEEPAQASREQSYVIFDSEGRRVDHDARIALAVAVSSAPDDPETAVSELSWSLELDGETIADTTRTYSHAAGDPDDFEEDIELYADDYHRYWVNVRLVRANAHLQIDAAFTGL
jgi:class 3 adenylate cyclase